MSKVFHQCYGRAIRVKGCADMNCKKDEGNAVIEDFGRDFKGVLKITKEDVESDIPDAKGYCLGLVEHENLNLVYSDSSWIYDHEIAYIRIPIFPGVPFLRFIKRKYPVRIIKTNTPNSYTVEPIK